MVVSADPTIPNQLSQYWGWSSFAIISLVLYMCNHAHPTVCNVRPKFGLIWHNIKSSQKNTIHTELKRQSPYRCWVSLVLLLLLSLSALYFLCHWLKDVLWSFTAAQSPSSFKGTYCTKWENQNSIRILPNEFKLWEGSIRWSTGKWENRESSWIFVSTCKFHLALAFGGL